MLHAARHNLVLPVYIATVFLSAALLFAVQPIFAKMVLPRLGGAPAVWSVALVFFQAVLLAGYAWAHLLTRFLPARISAAVQVVLMVAATLTLPLGIAAGWRGAPGEGEILWLLGLFGASIGLPFFALSANAPLLQAWFARTGHAGAANPYFLYAASNVGSFAALIAYPFLIEPFSRLTDQARAWSVLFFVLIGLLALGGGALVFSGLRATAAPEEAGTRPTARDALVWVALAAVPSGLLVAVTAHVSTDIAAVPLLWVLPLALYLATFVIVFQMRPLPRQDVLLLVQSLLVIALAVVMIIESTEHILLQLALNLAVFFVCALVCHGELARRRPIPAHLTAFYMWMSVGGLIGGVSAALLAPKIFSTVAEYPLLIVLALLCRPGLAWPKAPLGRAAWLAAVALAVAGIVPGLIYGYVPRFDVYYSVVAGLLALAALVSFDTLAFAAAIAAAFLTYRLYDAEVPFRDNLRSFFGVYKITQSGQFRLLVHGTTIHGAERLADLRSTAPDARPEPLTYYHAGSALARVVRTAREKAGGGAIRIAVVGLGTGSLACYAQAGDTWHFYEIDPTMVRIARDPARFTFLARCAPDATMVIGDARLTLADAREPVYDAIVIDAFSSDTVPAHLMTREAMQVYVGRLAPRGLIAMHVSNRHMELASVVAGIAGANGLVARVNSDDAEDHDDNDYRFTSTVVAVARAQADFGGLAETESGWPTKEADPRQWVWTDDYSNIVGAMIRHLRE